MQTEVKSKELIYEGSVKRVFTSVADKDSLYFEFTDDYSVFDWGKMPDTIKNKGRALTIMGAFFFERFSDAILWRELPGRLGQRFAPEFLTDLWNCQEYKELCESGARSHYKALTKESGENISWRDAGSFNQKLLLQVKQAEVVRPKPRVVLGQSVFEYPANLEKHDCRLIPLEVVFRFGMPAGSSLKQRLEKDPGYAATLGLKEAPEEKSWFSRPVLEFFTKLEPKDRLLSVQEALLLSGLTGEQLNSLGRLSLLYSLALFVIFDQAGIELWDGKFEFVLDRGQILLADSIGPDELRLVKAGHQLSKEMIRQVYRGSTWETALKKAQTLAAQRQTHEWKSICREELRAAPETLPKAFKEKIDQLYGVITNAVTSHQVFSDHPDLDKFVSSLDAVSDTKAAGGTR